MKKVFMMLATMMMSVAMIAQDAVITFDRTEHDFGTIKEEGGRVTTTFEFKNEGMAPLVLSNVRASCGCTTPKWPKEPIEPGETGTITVTYNPNGRPGKFSKTVTVTSNATAATKKLYIKGTVTPKPAKIEVAYPVKMGELNLKSNKVDFGEILMGKFANTEIEYANSSENELTVEVYVADKDAHLICEATLKNVKSKETGKINITFDTQKQKLYGPVSGTIYVVVNGKKEFTPEYAIHIQANVAEDFKSMSTEDLQLAPICTLDKKTIELGTIAKGKTTKVQIKLTNNGVNPLYVRRALSEEHITSVLPKAIKSGKSGVVKLDIHTAKEGKYAEKITLITNDPKRPLQELEIIYTVE